MSSLKSEIQFHHHGRFKVVGGVLPDAITAYQTFGDSKNPCIVFPTCYGGKLDSESFVVSTFFATSERKRDTGLLGQEYMIGEEKVRMTLWMMAMLESHGDCVY